MQQHMFSLGEVAQKIGVAPFRITYSITTGLVPDASMRFAGRRVFTQEDVQRLALHFGVQSSASEADGGEKGEE